MKPIFIATVFGVFGAISCGGAATDDTTSSEQAADTTAVGSTESAIMVTAADVASAATSADDAATAAASGLTARFTPAGCASVTSQGDTVTIKATNCTGPFGLVKVTGTIAIVYGFSNGDVTFAATGANLEANRATVQLSATGTISKSQSTGVTTLTVNAMSNGTGPFGHEIARTGTYTVTWGMSCMTLNGSWSTTVGDTAWTTTLHNFAQCVNACPSAGGTVTYTNKLGGTIVLTYGGSSIVSYMVTPGNKTGSVTLVCDLN